MLLLWNVPLISVSMYLTKSVSRLTRNVCWLSSLYSFTFFTASTAWTEEAYSRRCTLFYFIYLFTYFFFVLFRVTVISDFPKLGWHFGVSQAGRAPVPHEERCQQQSLRQSHSLPEANLWVHPPCSPVYKLLGVAEGGLICLLALQSPAQLGCYQTFLPPPVRPQWLPSSPLGTSRPQCLVCQAVTQRLTAASQTQPAPAAPGAATSAWAPAASHQAQPLCFQLPQLLLFLE